MLLLLVAALSCLAACSESDPRIPRAADWIDRGMVLDSGWPKGAAWDSFMEGFYPSSVIRRGDTFYLYYGGSAEYIPRKDNIGPARRSLGVATSRDGLRWEKFTGNPVLFHGATGNPEEGSPAAAFHLQDDDSVVAFYSGGDSETLASSDVHFDIRQAVSVDGLTFTDLGVVVHYDDPGVFQSGDELFPLLATRDTGTHWNLLYHAGGRNTILSWASIGARDTPLATGPVYQPDGSTIQVRGSISRIPLDEREFALFTTTPGRPGYIEVRKTVAGVPDRAGFPVARYSTGRNAIFFLDRARKTWFQYYNDWRAILVRLAPFGAPDTTPPGAPDNLSASTDSADSAHLAWSAASDPETGILEYNIYRDGNLVGRTRNTVFDDSGLQERTNHVYSVSATNLHGTEGPAGRVGMTTLPDTVPPGIRAVHCGGNLQQVEIVFDEPVDADTATATSNFAISRDVAVLDATVHRDGRSIVLLTTPHAVNSEYVVRATAVPDRAASPNRGDSSATYTCGAVPGLIGYWNFDAGAGGGDSSGSGHHAEWIGTVQATAGIRGDAVRLDGLGAHVRVIAPERLSGTFLGSVTLSAWVRILDVPPDHDLSDQQYTLLHGSNLDLSYTHAGRLLVRAMSDGKTDSFSTDGSYDPGDWMHLAVVRDSEANTVSLYVNGLPAAGFPRRLSGAPLDPVRAWGKDYANSSYARHHERFLLGSGNPGLSIENWYAHADIDEVRLHERALSAQEISTVFRQSLPGSTL